MSEERSDDEIRFQRGICPLTHPPPFLRSSLRPPRCSSRTNATGDRLKEGININKGLFVLGKVVAALSDEGSANAHVPYRDSKLTCLLRQSLGGSSATCMIACLQPSDTFFEENHMTLEYAAKAALISN